MDIPQHPKATKINTSKGQMSRMYTPAFYCFIAPLTIPICQSPLLQIGYNNNFFK
jgi:hypothetical protein